ncbi:Ku protein [Streptomyces solisilvae]|uniref:non-homologous end joining protein Ku n=1 Tax=Streptomyces malaysiensis TaxID=92644 RepID=UPI00331A89CD
MYPATEDHSIRFRQIHSPDGGLIRNRRVCEFDGQVLEQQEIGRAYEAAKDLLVPISDEDLDSLPLPTARAIDVQAFVPEERLDAIRYGKPYFLEGDGAVAAKLYTLLREALKRSDKVAIAKFTFHGRERLGALRVVVDALVLQVMHWDDEIRSAEGIAPPQVKISDAEIDEAVTLMEAMGDVDINQYKDQYHGAMETIIRAKAEGAEPPKMLSTSWPPSRTVCAPPGRAAARKPATQPTYTRSADDGRPRRTPPQRRRTPAGRRQPRRSPRR